MKKMIHVGYEGIVALSRIVAIANPSSAPIKRMVRRAEREGMLIDLTYGQRRKSAIFLDSGHLVLAAIGPKEVHARVKRSK